MRVFGLLTLAFSLYYMQVRKRLISSLLLALYSDIKRYANISHCGIKRIDELEDKGVLNMA